MRCAPLRPTHPPSDVLSVGAAPPRPPTVRHTRVTLEGGPAPSEGDRAPPAGGCAPTPPSRTSALRRSGPPTRPRMFFLWGLRPHAPHSVRRTRVTLKGGPAPSEGDRASPGGGLRSHTPIPDERAARLWPAHPPSDVLSVGAAAPTPPNGPPHARDPEGGPTPSEGDRASPAGGCASHTPIPDERAARLWARPPALGCSFCGGYAPTPPNGPPHARDPRGRSGPLPRATARLLRGAAPPTPPNGPPHARDPRGRSGPSEGDRASPAGGCAPTPPNGPP